MDCKDRYIELYSVQPEKIADSIRQGHCHYAKMKYIEDKYGDVKGVFLNAYHWYVRQASAIVERPEQAESGIWTFVNKRYTEQHPGYQVMKLHVPVEEAVFFRMSDWNKVLNLRYVGRTKEEENNFSEKLEKYGVSYEGDVYQTSFYPQLKRELTESWMNLFRFDHEIKAGGRPKLEDLQAGLWCIKKEWVADENEGSADEKKGFH
ncbi:DUF3841 domain-containing protein [Lacrimispora sp.]|uniref:DUF3841 domain-containing protein n=1 Tax=Lacrimispora sp. TaxID=2719234 RepID=UPI0034611F5D